MQVIPMKKKSLLLIILCFLLALGIGFGCWASIPQQPFSDADKISILAVHRITVSQYSDSVGGDLSTGLPDEDVDVTEQMDVQQLTTILCMLRTNRIADPPVGPHKGGYLTSEISYEIFLACKGGGAYTLYVGNRYDGRLQNGNSIVYPIKDSTAWFALLEGLRAQSADRKPGGK